MRRNRINVERMTE